MRQQQISDVIQHHLNKWNKEYIVKVNHSDAATRVRQAMEKLNHNIEKMSVEGIELSAEDLAQMKIKIPEALKGKQVSYESVANYHLDDGAFQLKFGVDVTF